ncbi:nonribosomal peptide synthase, partial [Aspergillus brasiliensis]
MAVQRIQADLDLSSGPLFSVDLFNVRGHGQYLYLLAHQLIVDLVSWRIILQELEELLRLGQLNRPTPLPFSAWCRLQVDQAEGFLHHDTLLPFPLPQSDISYWGLESTGQSPTYGSAVEKTFRLEAGVSDLLLHQCPKALRVEPVDQFLSCLATSFGEAFTDRNIPTIFLESHGREPWTSDIDLSRTVGWFTTIAPVPVREACRDLHPFTVTEDINRTRKSLPDKGWAWWTAQFLSPTVGEKPHTRNSMEILFNYEGIYHILEREDSWLQHGPPEIAPIIPGTRRLSLATSKSKFRSDSVKLLSVFEVTAAVTASRLEFSFIYPANTCHLDRIHEWIAGFEAALVSTANRLATSQGSSLFPSLPSPGPRFPLSNYGDRDIEDLEKVLHQAGVDGLSAVEDIYSCSPMQEALLLSRLSDRADIYVLHYVWKLLPSDKAGEVDMGRLSTAWQAVVDRHPALRTIFVAAPNGHLDQVVLQIRQAHVHQETLGNLSEQDVALADLSLQTADQSIPQYNLTLVRTSNGEQFLKFAVSHTIFDGESAPVLAHEICAAYDNALHELPVPYSGLIAYLAERKPGPSLVFWKEKLSQAKPCQFPRLTNIENSTDKRPVPSHELVSRQPTIPLGTLQERCAQAGMTLSTLFLTVWALTLRVYTGQDSVCFGFLASGRDAPIAGVEKIIGPVLNMLICHVVFRLGITPRSLASKIQRDFLESLSHQFISLAEIQHELGLGQSSLFNSCISYQRSQKLPHVPGRTFQLERIGGQSKTEFDIMLNINVTDEDVTVVFKYWTSRLMRPDAIRVADTFDHILASVLDRLDTPLEQVNLLSVNDRLEITKWNDQEVMNAKKCVHTLVKHNAVERPDAIAIRSWDGDWTYAELDSAARTLSYELHDFGVGPEVVVPILAQRSVWAIIGALAVLKAGGACVSVRQDSANFSSDLKQSLSTFAVKVILAGPEFVDSAKELVPHVIPLGRTVKGVLHDGERAWNLATPENLSFVVWTTGWAGRPRAVLLDHKCVCSGALTQGSVLGLEGSSSVLQYSPLDDRMSVTEIWTTLILGGCVCIPRPGLSLSNILDTINGKHVTWACLPPTIAAALDCKSAPSLKTLVLTGEFASRRDLDRWKEVRLVYSYSTAEVGICAATVVTTSLINAAHIGRAVGNVKLWVTDPHRHDILCPIGAVGELVVEGSILPRGYGSSSASSSSAFVRGPAWTTRFPALDNDGERRIFKTGDLVKYGEDGTLRYISKKDHLASACSLERNLLLLPDIGRVAVVRALSGPLSEHLVAFYIPYGVQYSIDSMKVQLCKPDQVLQMQTLHRKFQDHLEAESDERVQVYFVPVQGIPLLSNGKINRKLLQGWLEDNDEEVYQRVYALNGTSQPQTIEPADQTEAAVAQIWSEVLSIPKDRIGRDVPFYNLGGDSISAIQAASRARRVNINLTAQDILQFRTVARIAPVVARREKAAVKTAHDADNEILEFDISPIQTLYFDADPDGSACYYQSIYLALRRPVASEIISPALRSLIQRHSMLRSRFQCIEGAWVQSISDDVQASFSLATVHNPSDDHIRDIIAERLKTINISSGPLVTALLFDDLPDRRQRFFLAAHHLVIDHVSWRVILGELEEAISGHITIGPEPFPYPKWSQSLRRFSMENFRNTRKTLPFDVPPIDLSFWGVTGDKNSHGQIQQQGFTLDEAMTECLLTRSQDLLRSEPIEVMLGAALHAFVRVFPDRGLPAMFNESHGRDALGDLCDISQTVGWFTTMAPVASSVGSSVLDTVRRVKDARHQLLRGGWPYFASRYLTPEGQASFGGHFPMEIILNYLGRYHIFEQGDGLFARLPAPDLPCLYPDLKRFSLFEILVTVDIGQLEVKFLYPQDIKHQSRIEEWIQQYRILLEEAFTGTEPLLSLNDFPLLSMGYEDLDRLAKEILPTIRGPATLTNLEELYPCTPIQSGLLVSQARNPAYYEYATIAEVYPPAAGQLVDAKRLARAWQELVRRHSILRTVFVESLSPDRLYDQAVLRDWNGEVMYPQVDSRDPTAILEDLPGIEFAPGHSLHRLAICVAENGAVFVRLDMNHAISDGASTSILFRDLALAYHGKLVGSPLSQYRDFVSFLLQDDKQKHLAYWVDRLSGAEPCLLPLSVHSEGPSNEIEFTRVSLPKPVSQLRTFCIRNGVTLSTLLQAAWAMVLRIYCDSDRVCFGYLVSGRDVPIVGVENVIGPFLNILVCQLAFDLHSSPDTTMHSIQNQFVEGLPHQFCPLADILHKLNLGDQRLFNTAFSFQRPSTSSRTDRDPLITFRRQRARDPTEFDVTIDVEESGDRLEVVLEHWAQRISSSLASHLADTFTAAILAILESPKLDLRLIDLTGPKSLSQIHRWNARPYPINDVCIHHAFEAQARRYPNAEAVCSFDGALSYAELDTLASNLAGELIAHGVTRGVLVPFILSKSYRAVVGILAILKAGGAGVPLDSRAPHHRLQTIVSDTKARVILCSSEFQHSASAIVSAVVVVDAVLADREHPRSHQLQDPSRPSDPAFVIFTSGSTGTPKGSILEHGSLSTSALSLQPVLNMHSGSRVLHFASYTFDVSIEEVCFTLMHGACICVVSEAERMDDLGSAMRRLGVTWAELTPTVAAMISPGDVPSLQTLVVRGEIPSQSVISSWALKVQLINTYGPSECSVTCTATDPLTPKAHGAHIGFPVGCRAWIVNPQTSSGLVPVGAVGELVVEGRIVARGYLSNPALSKARFLSSAPWLPDDAAGPSSLYLTGDLVRYSDDGSLTFVGRRDGQAKLHGQRLEVGEIEYQVAVNAPQADQVAVDVLPISGIASRKALVAFLALRIGDARNEHQYILPVTDAIRDLLGEVKAGLAQTLPSYMIPSFYIPLSHLPQNLSGKTDRKALASLAVDFSETQWLSFSLSGSFKRPPATEPQRQLQQLWSDILGLSLSAIGQDDHFFQVGGDSVFAIHLSAAARKLGLSLPVGKIFQYPTLASMAAVLQHSGNACSKPTLPEHSPYELVALDVSPDILRSQIAQAHRLHTKILDIYPCTPLQEGLFALTLRSPRNYVSRRIYLLPSSLDIGRFKVAWQQVVSRIHILRTRISFALSNRAYQFIVPEEPSWSFAESLPNYLADDDARPFSEGKPLSRYAIVHDRENDYFVWTIHHALYDGWSDALVWQLLTSLYHQLPAPFSVVPFHHFVQHLSSQNSDASDAFWTSYLSGTITAPFPSCASSLPSEQRPSVQTLNFSLTGLPTRQANLATLLKAAWALVVAQYTNCADVVFGVTLSGRDIDLAGIETVAGPTIATVPFRVAISKEISISEFIARLQSDTVSMINHQHVGLQHIRALGDDARSACGFQNLLIIQPRALQTLEDSSLNLIEVPEEPRNFTGYPLVLECTLSSEKVLLQATHDVNALSIEQARRILQQMSTVLHGLLTIPPEKAVREALRFNTYDEDLVTKWNSQPFVTVDRCVHHLILEHRLLTPTKEAVRAWDASLTFQELDGRSNRLAISLIQCGVVPGKPVGFSLPRSSWSVVVLLAILKAGGVFVFIDAKDSDERLEQIIGATGMSLVVTQNDAFPRFTSLGLSPLSLSTGLTIAPAPDSQSPLPELAATSPAYIIFTSGSTGIPKGVVVSHAALSSSLTAHGGAMGIATGSRMLHYSSYSFDISVMEIFTTLALGGCVCVPGEDDRMANLESAMQTLQVNMAILTPTVARLLKPEEVPGLKTLYLIGEAPHAQDVAKWANQITLMNTYGPAEATLIASVHAVFPGDDPRDIGSSLTGDNLWIADADNHHILAPVGAIGELLIEGPILADGYLADPQKTSSSFISDPQWCRRINPHKLAHRRFYKTGDLVRYNDAGSILYVGRKDTQIKINGQRIELGEIEHRIQRALPIPFDFVVGTLSAEEHPDKQEVVIYFRPLGWEPDQGSTTTATPQLLQPTDHTALVDVRNILLQHMDPHLVPTLFFPVSFIPMNKNGKVDRMVLHRLAASVSLPERPKFTVRQYANPELPMTVAERALQKAWSRVLGIAHDQISANDSFIQLGGNSLTAIRLVAAAREARLVLAVKDVFSYPRLSDMARRAEDKLNDVEFPSESSITEPFSLIANKDNLDAWLEELESIWDIPQHMVADAYPTTPLQEGLLAVSMRLPGSYVTKEAYRLPENIDLDRFASALQTLVVRHPILRTRLVPATSEGTCQVVVKEHAVQRITVESFEAHIDITADQGIGKLGKPLAELAVLEESTTGRAFLLWNAHHSVYDAWMTDLLWADLDDLYHARHIPDTIPPFAAFVAYVQSVQTPDTDDYWRQYLANVTPTVLANLPSPSHHPRASQSLHKTFVLPFELPSNITLATIIRAAWAILLFLYRGTGDSDVVFPVTQSGRNAPVNGITKIVGPTITTFPLRVRWKADTKVSQLLGDLQDAVLDLIPYEQAGLQHIRELGHDCQVACDSDNLLVIHTQSPESETPLRWRKMEVGCETNFLSYALTVE